MTVEREEPSPMNLLARTLMACFEPGEEAGSRTRSEASATAGARDQEPEPSLYEAHLAFTLGLALEGADRPRESMEFYCRAVRMYGAVGEPGGEAMALTKMANVFRRHAGPDRVAECWKRALDIAGCAVEREAGPAALSLFAVAYQALGRHVAKLKPHTRDARETG